MDGHGVFLSRFAFIFLIYTVVTSGYINEILSCQMQRLLKDSKYFRHVLGVLLVFVFIMMEGGWSWRPEVDQMADTNWSTGNVVDTLSIAALIYLVFLVSSKSRVEPNLVFYSLVLLVYFINTQRNYYNDRQMLSEAQNRAMLALSKGLFVVAVVVLAYGFVDYVFYQRRSYGSAFRWSVFFLGVNKCRSLKAL